MPVFQRLLETPRSVSLVGTKAGARIQGHAINHAKGCFPPRRSVCLRQTGGNGEVIGV